MLRAVLRGTYPKRPYQSGWLYVHQNGDEYINKWQYRCGKSYLACALAYEACAKGIKAMYFNMNKLTEQILLSKVDGTYLKLLARLENTHYLYWTTLAYRL